MPACVCPLKMPPLLPAHGGSEDPPWRTPADLGNECVMSSDHSRGSCLVPIGSRYNPGQFTSSHSSAETGFILFPGADTVLKSETRNQSSLQP